MRDRERSGSALVQPQGPTDEGQAGTRAQELAAHAIILHWCQRSDPRGLELLHQRWDRRLFYFARRLSDSDEQARDAAQEIWVEIARGVHQVREPARLTAWVYQVAHHVMVDQLRRSAQRALEPLLDEPVADDPDPAAISFAASEAAELHRALDQLSLHHREVIVLHFLEGFSVAEVAALTQAPPGTVKSRIYHAKRILRDVLHGD
ncbi:MAG: sigma-70 family RNA polymerase sigma factor [Armatimonadetes bacterium]|nr:sigma-70 family RNA polymerase sigma factor [Armatimonadota bacterium]